MNQLKDAMQKAGLDRSSFPSATKDQKPKRVGKRSTGEITLRALRLLLISQALRNDRHKQITGIQEDEIFDALVSMFGEVSERLEEYDSEREAQQHLSGKT